VQFTFGDPEAIPEPYIRRLTANKMRDSSRCIIDRINAYHHTKSTWTYIIANKGNTKPELHSAIGYVVDFGISMGNACLDCSFFNTGNARLGIGPAEAKTGGIVCIFYNGNTPFLLRPSRVDSKAFELVGGASIDGIMYGEAIDLD
jgi:hypothetical protein